jgi:hypothetical protein
MGLTCNQLAIMSCSMWADLIQWTVLSALHVWSGVRGDALIAAFQVRGFDVCIVQEY